jgi:hypothetical protein
MIDLKLTPEEIAAILHALSAEISEFETGPNQFKLERKLQEKLRVVIGVSRRNLELGDY